MSNGQESNPIGAFVSTLSKLTWVTTVGVAFDHGVPNVGTRLINLVKNSLRIVQFSMLKELVQGDYINEQ